MRHAIFALGLILWAANCAAFEIEEERVFAGQEGGPVMSILSTTDTVVFTPVILAFQAANPDVTVQYTVTSTQQLFQALAVDGASFDLAVSSAMDLQMKLANDGLATAHDSQMVEALPTWARWRNHLFAFSQEPVVLLVRADAFEGRPLPRTRSELIDALREAPEEFSGRVGTYDPARSGAGYLFATQDARQSDTFWRLAEVMGSLVPKLYSSTGDMIRDLETGELAAAYNVLGSYVPEGFASGEGGALVELQDFTHILLRTALIPASAERPDLGADFLDFLVSPQGQAVLAAETGLPPIDGATIAARPHLRPIRLDTGLLVFVDPLMRQRFLGEWRAAVTRP